MSHKTDTSRSLILYFLIAVGFTWLFWIPAALGNENIQASPRVILLYIGGAGPALGGVLLTCLNRDKESRREYWRRVWDVKRIGWKWYLLILLAFPLITALLGLAVNGQVQLAETFTGLLPRPVSLITYVIFIFAFGPLPEEFGWRGYALPGLQRRMNALAASLLLGLVWGIWHIPLFFMKGTFQYELGFASAAFWRFMAFAVLISIFFTWIYNNNRGSTLSAILFHFSINFTVNLLVVTDKVELYRIILFALLAVALVVIYGAKDFVRKT